MKFKRGIGWFGFSFVMLPLLAATAWGQTNLPTVNVFAVTNAVPEGEVGYFVFTTDKPEAVTLNIELSGTATPNDFGIFTFPFQTTIGIDKDAFAKVLPRSPILDGYVEATETLMVKILPSANYTIGGASQASFDILDRTLPTTTNAPIIVLNLPNTNFVAGTPMPVTVRVTDTNSQQIKLQLYVDDALVDERTASILRFGDYTLYWQEPTLGLHRIVVAAGDERLGFGITTPREILVASKLLTPAWTRTLSPTGPYPSTNAAAGRDPLSSENRGYAEFQLPEAATNLQADLFFQWTGNPPVEIFAYKGGVADFNQIAARRPEFVDTLQTNVSSGAQVEITRWARKFAGGKLGIEFAIPNGIYGDDLFSKISLRLMPEGILEGAPHVEWRPAPPIFIQTNSIMLTAEITDPYSAIDAVYLFDGNKPIATNSPSVAYAAGTNLVRFNLQNLTSGPHYFTVRANSLYRTGSSEERPVTLTTNQPTPAHRWLGAQESSQSFYVVDAAGRAHVWGHNDHGQLGLGFVTQREYGLKHPVTLLAPDGLRFAQISSTYNYALALMEDGSVYKLDANGIVPVNFPTSAMDYYYAVSASTLTGTTVDQSRNVWYLPGQTLTLVFDQWDVIYSQNGLLFRDVTMSGPFPFSIDHLTDVAGGAWPYSYVITKDHRLYGWSNSTNQLMEVTVSGVSGWQRVVTSPTITLAIDDGGKVWSWGASGWGIGTPQMVPFPKSITNWLDIAATTTLRMALSAEGELYAWGTAAPGVWNNPAAATATVPEVVKGLPNLLDPNSSEIVSEFLGASVSTNGIFLQVSAPARTKIGIESSSDLTHWTKAADAEAQVGVTAVSLPADTNGVRFYRIKR